MSDKKKVTTLARIKGRSGTTNIVKLDSKKLTPIRAKLGGDIFLATDTGNTKLAGTVNSLGWITCLGSMGLFLTTGGLGAFALVFAGEFAALEAARRQNEKQSAFCKDTENAVLNARSLVRDELLRAQKESYKHKHAELVMLADKQIKDEGKIDEELIPFIAAIKPEALKDASDALAVTVLQLRQVLLYDRRTDAEKVVTFESLSKDFKLAVNPQTPEHQKLLEKTLWQNNHMIEEDFYPSLKDYPELDMSKMFNTDAMAAIKALKESNEGGSQMKKFFTLSAFTKKDAALIEKIKKLDIIADNVAVEVPPIKPVDNMIAVLNHYERETGKLDLPAVRGWGEARLAPGAKKQPPVRPQLPK